jgi:hypothetical protein
MAPEEIVYSSVKDVNERMRRVGGFVVLCPFAGKQHPLGELQMLTIAIKCPLEAKVATLAYGKRLMTL